MNVDENIIGEGWYDSFLDNVNIPNTENISVEYYQTENAKETIAIVKEADNSISIGIARAGRTDIEKGWVTPKIGKEIAFGRALKAKGLKKALIKKNYLRGIHAVKA